MDKLVKDGFILKIFVFIILLSFLLKSFSILSFANDRSDLQYYGDYPNYTRFARWENNNYRYEGEQQYTENTGIFQYVDSNFVYRQCVFSENDRVLGMSSMYTNGVLTLTRNDNTVHAYSCVIDNKTYYYSLFNLKVSNTSFQINFDSPTIICNSAEDGISIILSGVEQWYSDQRGASLENANINVDTSNIEQLITSGNSINQITSKNVSSINETLVSNSSSQITFGDEEKSLMKSYKEWLILIGFCVSLLLSRTVLHQMGRNIRGRS